MLHQRNILFHQQRIASYDDLSPERSRKMASLALYSRIARLQCFLSSTACFKADLSMRTSSGLAFSGDLSRSCWLRQFCCRSRRSWRKKILYALRGRFAFLMPLPGLSTESSGSAIVWCLCLMGSVEQVILLENSLLAHAGGRETMSFSACYCESVKLP